MRPDLPTPHQLAVIHATGDHVLVAAGAGSGKTATVINRLLYLLGAPVAGEVIATPVPIERLTAITYTIAAAAQLKQKLRHGLRAAGLTDVAWRVDAARIGTIHGFCAEILQEFALRRGVSPQLAVLEEGDATTLKVEATRDALMAALAAGEPGLDRVVSHHGVPAIREAIQALVGRVDQFSAADHPPEEALLLSVAREATTRLEHALVARGAVDFDRMLAWTRDLLRDDPYVRRTLQRRVHTLVVDEFQDVDPVQWEIIQLLAAPESGRTDTPRLLLVGDAKQGIFRFRGADVTMWRRAEALFAGGAGQVIPLNENFRSTAPILDFVAATVGRRLDTPVDPSAAERAPYEIDFARLEPGHPRQADGPPVELLVMPPEAAKVDEVRQVEGQSIAARARALHQSGIAWREMALLCATWDVAGTYQAILRSHGIPTYLSRDEGFYDRREVLDQVVALQAACDPTDDLALMGFLRSPFVGLRDETLLAIAQGGRPYWPRLVAGEAIGNEPALLARGVALLERTVGLRDRVPSHVLLAELLDRSGYWAHLALCGEDRAQAIANVRQFLHFTRAAAESTLADYLRGIEARRTSGERVGDARLHGERDDVLTISTVHSAKGLQWRVVFWADLCHMASGRHPRLLIGRDRIALKDPELGDTDQPDHLTALKQALALEQEAERRRVEYVAATRAAEHLIVSAFFEPVKRSTTLATIFDEMLGVRAAAAAGRLDVPRHGGGMWTARVEVMAPVDPTPPVAPPATSLPVTGPHPPLPVGRVGRLSHSATEAMTWQRCPRKHWFRYVLGVPEPEPVSGGGWVERAAVRGQVVHEVMERLRGAMDLDGLVEAVLLAWDADAPAQGDPAGAAYRAALRADIERVATHPEWRRIATLPGAHRERTFLWLNGRGGMWTGAIDLMGEGAEGVSLLDIKTGGGADPDPAAKVREYEAQWSVYCGAVEAIGQAPVREFLFVLAANGGVGRVDVTSQVRDEARARVIGLAEALESGDARLTSSPGQCVSCGFRTAGWCPGAA